MIDTHTHLTDDPLHAALDAVLARAAAHGVQHCIVPGYNAVSWQRARVLCRAHAQLSMAVGLHPLFVGEKTLAQALEEIRAGGIVAVGEIGLDYVDPRADRAAQHEALHAQLRAACDAGLPVILHCRQAHDDLLTACRAYPGLRAVLHSCSCSHEQVKPFLELGFYVGFSGSVTRATTHKVKKLAAAVPRDRIVAETDSPYIGTAAHPAPSSEPADTAEVVAALASIRECNPADMARITTENAARFFSLGAA